MANDRSLVRASDIGLWAFCHRAWWLAHVTQAPHQNPQLLAHGVARHVAHGADLQRAQWLQRAGVWLLIIALFALLALLALFAARWLF